MGTEKFTSNQPPELLREFRAFCEDTGLVMQRAVAAGLVLVQATPLELRDRLMRGDQAGMVEWLSRLSRWADLAEQAEDPDALEALLRDALHSDAERKERPATRSRKGRKAG